MKLKIKTMVKKIMLLFLLIISWACKDEVQISERIVAKTFNYPILVGKEDNPFIRLQLDSETNDEIVNAIQVSIDGIKKDFIKNIRVYYTENDSLFSNKILFGMVNNPKTVSLINGKQNLKSGTNYFWVSYELTDNVDLTDKVYTDIDYVTIGDKKFVVSNHTGTKALRLGVAVRQHQEDNVHTYRIPGLTTTKDGSLLAVYDVRRESGRDLQGHMDIGVSRSIDNGNTWEPMRIALDMGEWGGLPQKFNGVSDANILVDKNTGTIYLAGLWMHGVINAEGIWQENLTEESDAWNHQWRTKGSQSGFGVKQTSQFLITKSSDDGRTWSDPINLTEMCKDPKWWLWAPAPGHGITLKDGTLVIPTQGRDENGIPFSNITYSKDGGNTWTTSNPASQNTTECMAVELSNGHIMLNIRDNKNREDKSETNGRKIMITEDLGETWTEHPTSNGALIEPTCMASIHRHDYTDNEGASKSIMVFSNPNSKYKRIKQTIKVSLDDGNTWPREYWMELDEGRGAGYSCITSVDNDHIGILYEGSQAHMTFQKININELIKKHD
ncbi:sialidase family protein [Arenibacter sp. S6351L]|uniref:sialidase family protein n=1 Tax=Arenibacter sp. S6351L TaxID=2926407 RepID=UPI001FF45C83|nr:sialidase family protein [Arenibacter sp. S6351L]MCK0135699.1 exo-alpha-sialidase [Arenibacter sp. S6351L]